MHIHIYIYTNIYIYIYKFYTAYTRLERTSKKMKSRRLLIPSTAIDFAVLRFNWEFQSSLCSDCLINRFNCNRRVDSLKLRSQDGRLKWYLHTKWLPPSVYPRTQFSSLCARPLISSPDLSYFLRILVLSSCYSFSRTSSFTCGFVLLIRSNSFISSKLHLVTWDVYFIRNERWKHRSL